jgi:hypothetical protein
VIVLPIHVYHHYDYHHQLVHMDYNNLYVDVDVDVVQQLLVADEKVGLHEQVTVLMLHTYVQHAQLMIMADR